MSSALNAVYAELKRLQVEGITHVFIQDQTMARLNPDTIQATGNNISAPDNGIDLQAAVTHKTSVPKAAIQSSVKPTPVSTAMLAEAPIIELPDGDPNTQMAWLKHTVEHCPVCKQQCGEQEQIVFGSGNIDADILWCGDAPDEAAAVSGKPFQGKSGELLNKILAAMGLKRESVYMTHILKWRPKHEKTYAHRAPTPAEMEYCRPFLKAQIDIVQPQVIVALGNASVAGLLGSEPNRNMASLRGTWQSFERIPLMFTFSPAYLLANDTIKTKRMVWEDMLKVMEKMELPISDKQRQFFLPK